MKVFNLVFDTAATCPEGQIFEAVAGTVVGGVVTTGSPVGPLEGVAVGTEEGPTVEVNTFMCVEIGALEVGLKEGNRVGPLVGDFVGTAVGEREGVLMGPLDGKGDGPLVGDIVGANVGKMIGAADGLGLGTNFTGRVVGLLEISVVQTAEVTG